MSHQALLDPMSQEISETAHLSRLFLADQDGLVASAPDGTLPVVQRDRVEIGD
jgi:hypothetical protein